MLTVALILRHTPPWVFAVFALMVVLGLRGLRPRTISPLGLFTVPIGFIVWGLVSLARRIGSAPMLILDWAAAGIAVSGLTAGNFLGWSARFVVMYRRSCGTVGVAAG